MNPINLSSEDKADLLAFLKSLAVGDNVKRNCQFTWGTAPRGKTSVCAFELALISFKQSRSGGSTGFFNPFFAALFCYFADLCIDLKMKQV